MSSTPGMVPPTLPAGVAPAVEVRGVVKRYPLFSRRRDRVLALLGRSGRLSFLTALSNVDLVAHPGEAVGLIGENGSGKTTLLRVVAGITVPDAGQMRVEQPVAAILELGLGFHPEFSGRQNALLYGELIGVPGDTMRERLAEVLDFAELGAFADFPLRTYSSGMRARLAFAVATNVAPNVLVVDEALAVGDGAFQKKCVDRMVQFKEEGRTVLFCSHSMYHVASFCERAVWLAHGKVQASGPAQEVITAYQEHLRHREQRAASSATEFPVPEKRLAWLRAVRVMPVEKAVSPGQPLDVEVEVQRGEAGLPVHIGVAFETADGVFLTSFLTIWDDLPALTGDGDQTLTLHVPASPFARGELDVIAYLFDGSGLHLIDSVRVKSGLKVTSGRWEPALVHTVHEWVVG